MKSLTDLRLFVRTAHAGSLSAAARQLDTTAAAASASLKRLERSLGAALFVRSTRSLRLTSEGETFLRHCEQALQAFVSAEESMRQSNLLEQRRRELTEMMAQWEEVSQALEGAR